MAYVESAVVVYLRAIYYPQGFSFPLVLMPPGMVVIEIGREAATLVMLLGVAMLAGTERWDRIGLFCIAFGVWDIASTSGCGCSSAGRRRCSRGMCCF